MDEETSRQRKIKFKVNLQIELNVDEMDKRLMRK